MKVARDELRRAHQALCLWRDEKTFSPLDGALAPPRETWRNYVDMLGGYHERYVTEVSDRVFAASLESCALLYHLCDILDVASILDVGTGFTSFVFRHYAGTRNRAVRVVSVDHDESWLDRTKNFLEKSGCRRDDLITLSGLDATIRNERFGLIYNDAWGPLRPDLIARLAGHLAPGGAFVVDDTNVIANRRALMRAARSVGLRLYDIRPWTYDTFGRWACLAM